MSIQTSLRQWSSSTLHKGHRETGEEAANRIDELENSLRAVVDELESWNLTEGDPKSIKVLKAANEVLNKK